MCACSVSFPNVDLRHCRIDSGRIRDSPNLDNCPDIHMNYLFFHVQLQDRQDIRFAFDISFVCVARLLSFSIPLCCLQFYVCV